MSPTICLNMIVKNESPIIVNTLTMLCNKINFSYWVICDTGSTDSTLQLITEFFKQTNIPGELHEHKWQDFAHNRSLALNLAFDKTDLVFIFDADDEIEGTIEMPSHPIADEYSLQFGTNHGISYCRPLLVNNRLKWEYLSIIHEFINCLTKPTSTCLLVGNYYIISGKHGNRSKDPNTYLKDAKLLEAAHETAKQSNDRLYLRYAFYCANSYKDFGDITKAIEWYNITLSQPNWVQEKYVACMRLFECHAKQNQPEVGFYYLVESIQYDSERPECLYELIRHYCGRELNQIAYNYYRHIQDFIENKYLTLTITDKLFLEPTKYDLLIPYYMILVAHKVKHKEEGTAKTITKMYEIIFTKKSQYFEMFYIEHLLYNLQFFIDICEELIPNFNTLFKSYIDFLLSNEINVYQFSFMKQYETLGCIVIPTNKITTYSTDECSKSVNILVYTGFCDVKWNETYIINNALGGSETAVIQLAREFPQKYNIYITGSVAEESVGNVHYINIDTFNDMLVCTAFHTVIVSRYIGFYELYPLVSYYQSFIWAHDCSLINYGSHTNDCNQILHTWDAKITGCVCQNEWHKQQFVNQYPSLSDKITCINNGISPNQFILSTKTKIPNRFIYTSRPERGLIRLLELWPEISEIYSDAYLIIASYCPIPLNTKEGQIMKQIIDCHKNIIYLGGLDKPTLYGMMNSAEYWLYPTCYNETSCITAMEMLMAEVICIYYPIGGLIHTIGEYGIAIKANEEIKTINELTNEQKSQLRINGREYALSCSWLERNKSWVDLMHLS